MSVFRKHDDGPVSTALEAQGLTWLAEAMADGGAHVVPVTSGPGWLEEPRLTATSVTPAGAEAFGRALAVTHAAGAPAFGAAPPGWDGRAQMGRSDVRLRPHAAEEGEPRRWGEFYAEDRILPYLPPSRDNGSISAGGAHVIERLCERLRDGDFDNDQPALVRAGARERGERLAVARTHGDLWCGNVLWTPADEAAQWAPPRAGLGPQTSSSVEALTGDSADRPTVVGVLIDPMAQGAHAETDLAAGWRERVGLHSWHIIMIHAFLFGGGYGGEAIAVARPYL